MNKEIQKIKPSGIFTNYIYKAIPLAFDESMSYYETLCGILSILKTQEEVINNNADLLAELELYVKNYFENLDIQTEINNKLDQMAESGELADIIAQYIELQGILAYDTIDDMKNATNLSNGSFAKTYGYNSYNDGQGGYYKVRTMLNTDVIDNKTIVALHDPSLIAELIISIYVETYNSVADMKDANNLVDGRVVRTCGYYSVGDGGSALYKIRKFVVGDVTNNSTLILLTDTNYVAELLVNGCINVKQFGAKGDGVTDDTTALQDAFNYLRTYPRAEKDYSQLYFPDGKYLVTDTITYNNGRFSKIYGKCNIIGNFNKPIIEIDSSMWIYIDDIMLEQQNTGSDSGCLKIRNSYILKINEIYANGGDKGVDVVGNNITFDACSFRNSRINFYTTSQGNNTQNTLINCAIENASDYNLYFGWTSSFYGLWVVENCYIEGSATSHIYLKNGIRLYIKNCYINQTGQNSCFTFDGTLPRLHMYITDCQINSNGYVYKEIGQNRYVSAYVGFNDITGTLFNDSDTYKPSIVNITPNKLNIYNLTWLKDTNSVLDNWLGAGTYSLQESICEESINAISITSSYIYKQFYLKKDVTYKFEVYMKSNGSSNAQMDLYDLSLGSRKFRIETANTEFTKIISYYKPTENAKYNLLLHNGGTFCGINIYSLEVSEY